VEVHTTPEWKMTEYDAIIIRTGQAGPPLARHIARTGMQVAIIERGRFGGTYVNSGYTSTKTLVASAYAAHVARRGADYGFSAGDIKIDMKRVKARKDHARFASPREVQVGSEVLTSDQIFINVSAPPLGRVGMTEAEVHESGRSALIGKLAMEDVSRAFEKGETEGFMKILIDAETREILGASFLGTSGDEVIHCVLDTMYAKAPYTQLKRAIHIHPTVAKFIPAMLDDLVPLSGAAAGEITRQYPERSRMGAGA
jgi:pyruvate/2-oxoglutarate dehydrogenase complex dihydrolipoamide dehydrogenase (E3) component